jgi:hypothetical protein
VDARGAGDSARVQGTHRLTRRGAPQVSQQSTTLEE